jgi:hypothetical protein
MGPPMMQTPPHAQLRSSSRGDAGPYAAVTTGNPITGTFSGVEPSAGLPKKGAPVALFVGN